VEVDKAATKDQFHALSNQKVSLSYYMMMAMSMMMMEMMVMMMSLIMMMMMMMMAVMMTLIRMRMMDDDNDTRDYSNVYHISIYLLAVTSQFTSLGGYVRAPDGRRRVGE